MQLGLRLPIASTVGIRGAFPTLNFGLHYGQGHTIPKVLWQTKATADIVGEITSADCVQRLAAYTDGMYLN